MLLSPSGSSTAPLFKSFASKSRRAKLGSLGGPVAHVQFTPQAFRQNAHGWQTGHGDVKSRVASLFNSHTMSDVTFQVEVHTIPAHRFVLASASPIFYKQLYEDRGPGMLLRQESMRSEGLDSAAGFGSEALSRNVMLPIMDVPHRAFFEFLQFLYSDTAHITLDNVIDLMALADTYKVGRLGEQCLEYLRVQVAVPGAVLRVLRIVHTLELKAIFGSWSEAVQVRKALQRYRQLSLAERRMMQETDTDCGSIASSRPMSMTSRRSERSSMSRTSRSLAASSVGVYKREADTMDEDFMNFYEDEGVLDLAAGTSKKSTKFDHVFKGSYAGEAKVGSFCHDLESRCWKCIQEETDTVIACADVWEQDVTVIREILRLGSCSVPEVALFRLVSLWAQHQCRLRGVAPTVEGMREAIGPETLRLVRFPTMTVEQLTWEVIPTGLLPHEDVQHLLQTMGRRSAQLGKFNANPRGHMTLRKSRGPSSPRGVPVETFPGEVFDALQYAAAPAYVAAPGDPIDAMLAAELLRLHLRRRVATSAEEAAAGGAAGGGPRSRTAGARLPVITPRGEAAEGQAASAVLLRGLRPVPPSSPRKAACAVSMSLSRSFSTMALGQRPATGQAEAGSAMKGSRLARLPEWVRLAPGLYRFRGERLLEVWIEQGEAVAKDHGPVALLEALAPGLAEAEARRLLGLAQGPPMGRGVPLGAFFGCQ